MREEDGIGVMGAPAPLPLNGIPATWSHDEGAYAQCGDCGRYTLDPTALCARGMPTCECGSTSGWSGSFKRPGPEAKWSGRTSGVTAAPAPKPVGYVDPQRLRNLRTGKELSITLVAASEADLREGGDVPVYLADGVTADRHQVVDTKDADGS